MSKQVIAGTMVIIAPETASPKELQDTVGQACAVHQGPVVVLPHNWAALPVDIIRAQLDAIEAIHKSQSIGPSKPPPPPPPPAAVPTPDLACPVCKLGPQSEGHGLLESLPPIVVWCDKSRTTWDSYQPVLSSRA